LASIGDAKCQIKPRGFNAKPTSIFQKKCIDYNGQLVPSKCGKWTPSNLFPISIVHEGT
jgi:hypothetical protein